MSNTLEAWKAWCKQTSSNVGDDAFTLEKSSHGKAFSFAWDAATEAQQSWIASLEQHAKDADRLWQEREAELAAAQKRIELYEQALKASWPDGAMGDAFDYWNAARKEGVHES